MKKLFFLLVLCFFILSVFNVRALEYHFSLIGKTIVIDAGHGGKDAGAISGNVLEKDLNLIISLNIKKHLEKMGANIIMVRNDDYDLSKPNALYRKKSDFDNRISLINNSHADMYLSIHMNYFSSSKYRGPQVFYYPILEVNEKIALNMQNVLNEFSKTKRKIKINSTAYLYKRLNVPGVLIECGFISNPTELNNLKNLEYQNKLAETITNGVINYFQ